MNSLYLKIIALSTMLIDHIGAIFLKDVILLRVIGRLAFPIYCFLLVEGYFNTKDIKKYLSRLLIFAFISEIPFNLAFYDSFFWFDTLNVYFTLFIGLLVIYFCERYTHPIYKIFICFIGMLVAELIKSDYSSVGILMIYLMYAYRDKKVLKTIGVVILNFFVGFIQAFAGFSMLFIVFYNGKKVPDNKRIKINKYIFYMFYPLHLLFLKLISLLVL